MVADKTMIAALTAMINTPILNTMDQSMTQSLEDYLEMVSFLADEGSVRVTDIASRLGVSKPSVFTALKTLESQGLLEREPYRSVCLTDKGRLVAAEIRERHSMLTAFLCEIIGVSAETAEKDACSIEHYLSVETLEKMRSMVRNLINV